MYNIYKTYKRHAYTYIYIYIHIIHVYHIGDPAAGDRPQLQRGAVRPVDGGALDNTNN